MRVLRGQDSSALSVKETDANLSTIISQFLETRQLLESVKNKSEEARLNGESGKDRMNCLKQEVQMVEKLSSEVSGLVQLIDEIAFQTNLLALNASVEAARAGESGKGFAVVADAVRNLAQKSGESATKIKSVILTTSERVTTSVEISDQVEKELNKIISQIGLINTDINQVAEKAYQQGQSLNIIKQSIDLLSKSSQINASAAVELSSSASATSKNASQLKVLCSDLDHAISY